MDVRTRIKKTMTKIPHSLLSASAFLLEIGEKQKAIDTVNAELAKQVTALKDKAKKKVCELSKNRNTLTSALFAFAQARKALLTVSSKTVVVASGLFGWRFTPPAVSTDESDEVVIARLKRMGLKQFIRVKEELDREMLLSEKPAIKGVCYSQREEFFVVPNTEGVKRTITVAIDV